MKETFLFGQLLDLFFKAGDFIPVVPEVCRLLLAVLWLIHAVKCFLKGQLKTLKLLICILEFASVLLLVLTAVDSLCDGMHTDHVHALHVVICCVSSLHVRVRGSRPKRHMS